MLFVRLAYEWDACAIVKDYPHLGHGERVKQLLLDAPKVQQVCAMIQLHNILELSHRDVARHCESALNAHRRAYVDIHLEELPITPMVAHHIDLRHTRCVVHVCHGGSLSQQQVLSQVQQNGLLMNTNMNRLTRKWFEPKWLRNALMSE